MIEKDLKMLEDFACFSSDACPSTFRRYNRGEEKLSDKVKSIIDGPQKWSDDNGDA